MGEFEARVSFYGMEESAVDASLTVIDEHLTIEVSGRTVGRWPIYDLSPQLTGESVVVSAEGERLVIDVSDPEALHVSLRGPDRSIESPAPSDDHSLNLRTAEIGHRPEQSTSHGHSGSQRASSTGPSTADSSDWWLDPSAEVVTGDEQLESAPVVPAADLLLNEIQNLQTALAAAQAQLRWVQDLVPRRLSIPLRADEAGLGVVQGVHLKERRPLPGSDGLQPWVTVDSGNVYVTDRRLVFSGAQDVEFEFRDINKKGASQTGLLLGVSSRTQAHILAGPGERLAVVLTAAEKIARGLDPIAPFREAIGRLTAEIDQAERRMRSFIDAPSTTDPASDQSAHIV